MGAISSINFKKSNAIQTRHNDRDLPPNYLIGGDCEANCSHKEALALKNQIIKNAIEKYTAHTGQKFQAKSYEWSAVVNIKPNTTMQELEKLTEHFSQKYGFQCYQIAIHRDEGHINEQGQKEINHHAHLEFITLDKETGKNRQRELKPQILRQIQDEVAEILQMQRGQDKRITKIQRIEPRKYAQMKELEKMEKQGLSQELNQKKTKNRDIQAELTSTKKELESTKSEIISAKEVKARLEQERKAWIQEKTHKAEEYKQLRALNEQQYETIKDLETQIEALNIAIKSKKEINTEIATHSIPQELEPQLSENEKLLQKLEKMHYFKMPKDDFCELKHLYYEKYNDELKKGDIDCKFQERFFDEAEKESEKGLFTLKNGDYLIDDIKKIVEKEIKKEKNEIPADLSTKKQKNDDLPSEKFSNDFRAISDNLNDNFQILQKENEELKKENAILKACFLAFNNYLKGERWKIPLKKALGFIKNIDNHDKILLDELSQDLNAYDQKQQSKKIEIFHKIQGRSL